MILSGLEIKKQYELKRIFLDPFNDERLTTNTYDLRLGQEIIIFEDEIIDPKKPINFIKKEINHMGFILNKGDFILGHSQEIVGSDYYVPIIHARSSIARLGLFVHVTADLIDIGSYGQITFQLYATLPIKITPGMLIAQVSFWVPEGEINLYKGKYQGSKGPQVSQVYKDFV